MKTSVPARRIVSKPKKAPALAEVCAYLEALLDQKSVVDWPHAMNGLQVENSGRIRRIGAAVDACEATLRLAAERGIDFLLVHHGLFWGGLQRVEGAAYRKLKLTLDADMAVFSSHLPLDLHPRFGNNAILSNLLGMKKLQPFFLEKGRLIAWKAQLPLSREELCQRLEKAVGGPVKLIPGGPARAGVVGVVAGGAGGEVARAAAEGVDTFISGEAPHGAFLLAEELGVNLLLAGHYATETFGVKALAAHLSRKHGLPWEFIDHPTGL